MINFFDDLNIKIIPGKPKYRQIIEIIKEAIKSGRLKRGNFLPSVNQFAKYLSISRLTVMAAYKELQTQGTVESIPGKGYFIKSTLINTKHKIFLLFDELNAFKEILYKSFINTLGDKAMVDIFFHYFNRNAFNHFILDNIGNYTSYVIMPVAFKGIETILRKIPPDRLYLLDQENLELNCNYSSVFQDFEKDMYNGLKSGIQLFEKYKKLYLVHYTSQKKPEGLKMGFIRFCEDYMLPYEVIKSIENRKLEKGDAFIVSEDDNLVQLVLMANNGNFELGKDIGIVSYNDTPLKKVVGKGITVISTDFKKMGENMANLILNKRNVRIKNPSSMIIRNSL